MMSVLGLPLELALERLNAAGVGDIIISRTCAPRAKEARGSLRVIKQNEDGTRLLVAAFADKPETKE